MPLTPANPPQLPWRTFAPEAHVVLIYSDAAKFLTVLENFVADAFAASESVIVTTTSARRVALEARLLARGFNLASFQLRRQYMVHDARYALSQFMVKGEAPHPHWHSAAHWPSASRFETFFAALVAQGQGATGRRVRVFDEAVNVLWGEGRSEAALQLEVLWDKACKREKVLRLCAYPKSELAPGKDDFLQTIGALHSHVIEV